MNVRVLAPAKINLTLQVGRPRADGLHPLESVVMFADVGDVVEAAPAATLSLEIEGPFAEGLSAGDDNLVLRAARALQRAAGVHAGATLRLQKNLPVASGIGGGSSDAAATLKALKELWGLGLDEAALADVARPLGADVPVCVAARTAYMTGAGERFTPIRAPVLDAVLVNPLRPLATADVYRKFDAMGLGAEFRAGPSPAWETRESALEAMAALGNDLEAPARALLGELDGVAQALGADARVRYAGLSGSGATMFAIVDSAEDARALSLALAPTGWWVRPAVLGVA